MVISTSSLFRNSFGKYNVNDCLLCTVLNVLVLVSQRRFKSVDGKPIGGIAVYFYLFNYFQFSSELRAKDDTVLLREGRSMSQLITGCCTVCYFACCASGDVATRL